MLWCKNAQIPLFQHLISQAIFVQNAENSKNGHMRLIFFTGCDIILVGFFDRLIFLKGKRS